MSDLLKINVNGHTEKKGNLTYLSWAWAWAEVLKIDPAATWVVHTYGPQGSEQPCMWIGDTAMVHTSVTVKGLRRECMLPVMDHKNNAVKQPDARKISDAIMRCMTKAIGMHGLGLYIYAGEDLPEVDDSTLEDKLKASIDVAKAKKRLGELDELAAQMVEWHRDGKDTEAIRVWYAQETFAADAETGNEERLYVWGQLKTESKLRSTIKANNPHHNKEHA
jgi:hypothetical protein